jgi:hypothetical protein
MRWRHCRWKPTTAPSNRAKKTRRAKATVITTTSRRRRCIDALEWGDFSATPQVIRGAASRWAGKVRPLTRASIRLCFCLAVAIIAAAVADVAVEAASNAGWFGPGNFTDRSDLDVIPALVVGCAFVVLYVTLRVRSLLAGFQGNVRAALRLSNEALGYRVLAMLPAILALQIVVLFSMETAEQLVVWGHVLGGTIWLGGPLVASLTAHAAACVAMGLLIARAIRSLATAALHVIRLLRALATTLPRQPAPKARRQAAVASDWTTFAPRWVGERAPPLPA